MPRSHRRRGPENVRRDGYKLKTRKVKYELTAKVVVMLGKYGRKYLERRPLSDLLSEEREWN